MAKGQTRTFFWTSTVRAELELLYFQFGDLALQAVYQAVPPGDLALFDFVAALNSVATLIVIAAFQAGEAAVLSPIK